MKILLIILLVCGFCGFYDCVEAQDELILSDKSYGLVTFGNKLSSIEKKIGERAKAKVSGTDGCWYVTFNKYPGIEFMVEMVKDDNVVTRADALSREIKNELHINIGTSLAEINLRFPKADVQPNRYDVNGHDIVIKSKDMKRAILIEESNGKVVGVRAGLEPSVEYVEGCL